MIDTPDLVYKGVSLSEIFVNKDHYIRQIYKSRNHLLLSQQNWAVIETYFLKVES
jgi:hypothetical protein